MTVEVSQNLISMQIISTHWNQQISRDDVFPRVTKYLKKLNTPMNKKHSETIWLKTPSNTKQISRVQLN